MANYRAYFEIPNQVDKKHFKGSAPRILKKLLEELEGAEEIYVSLFLYNNPFMHYKLEEFSKKGCKVAVYSIPLNGYDKNKVEIFKSNNESFYSSKMEYAEKVYERIQNKVSNIEIRVFPHTYIWYVQKFSRGKELYSLHNKSFMAKFKDGIVKCISSSSNFAFGDPLHSENLIVVENDINTTQMFNDYFELLHKNSLSLGDYQRFSTAHYDFEYTIKPVDLPDRYNSCYFSAPFIKYKGIGSNHYIQHKIINFIGQAKEKIYTCSQHFSDIDSFDLVSGSIVNAISNSTSKKNIDVRVLKQTRASHQKQGARTYASEESLKKISCVQQKYLSPTIHDKFIIVDDKIMVCTANFTPTQFAWDENKVMKYNVIEGNKSREYEIISIFSEINCFHFIHDSNIVKQYLSHFGKLWKMAYTI